MYSRPFLQDQERPEVVSRRLAALVSEMSTMQSEDSVHERHADSNGCGEQSQRHDDEFGSWSREKSHRVALNVLFNYRTQPIY